MKSRTREIKKLSGQRKRVELKKTIEKQAGRQKRTLHIQEKMYIKQSKKEPPYIIEGGILII